VASACQWAGQARLRVNNKLDWQMMIMGRRLAQRQRGRKIIEMLLSCCQFWGFLVVDRCRRATSTTRLLDREAEGARKVARRSLWSRIFHKSSTEFNSGRTQMCTVTSAPGHWLLVTGCWSVWRRRLRARTI